MPFSSTGTIRNLCPTLPYLHLQVTRLRPLPCFQSHVIRLASPESMRLPFEPQLVLFLTFTFLTINPAPALANAQVPPTEPPPTVNIKPYARGRIFSVSTESPIARTLSRLPDVVQATSTLIDYFQAVEETVSHSLAVSRGERPRGNDTVPICNNFSIQWRAATLNVPQHRGWPVDRNGRCITDIFGTSEVSHLTDADLEDAVIRHQFGIQRLTKDITKAVGLKNWTNSETEARYASNRGSQTCYVDWTAGLRVRGKWYTPASITNRPWREWLPSGERQYLTEYVRAKGGKLVSALMTLPVNPVEGTVHKVETRSTTAWVRWGGAVEPSQFMPAEIQQNLALQDSLDKGQHYLQQVEDATTASNVAILALPLVLSLVPIGWVADVTTKRMLVYVLLSDVITALPMWIKGVELVQISKKRFTSSVTRVGDVGVEENVTVVMELWVASCESQGNVREIGIWFMVIATLFMVLGMVLEIVVGARQARKRKAGQYKAIMEEFDGEDWVVTKACNGEQRERD